VMWVGISRVISFRASQSVSWLSCVDGGGGDVCAKWLCCLLSVCTVYSGSKANSSSE
jgi:hypothetical protein